MQPCKLHCFHVKSDSNFRSFMFFFFFFFFFFCFVFFVSNGNFYNQTFYLSFFFSAILESMMQWLYTFSDLNMLEVPLLFSFAKLYSL